MAWLRVTDDHKHLSGKSSPFDLELLLVRCWDVAVFDPKS
jgi:hypothetical protein